MKKVVYNANRKMINGNVDALQAWLTESNRNDRGKNVQAPVIG